MGDVELILISLFIAVALLNAAANWLSVPYPIVLVLGGVALALVPGVPDVELDPDLVLVIFLPPLLYAAAFFSDLRSLRANVRPLSLTSIGLVLVTTAAVAALAHEVIGMPWAVAFALGAIVSPTDPVASTTIMRRLDAPRRGLPRRRARPPPRDRRGRRVPRARSDPLHHLRRDPRHRRRPGTHAAGADPPSRRRRGWGR